MKDKKVSEFLNNIEVYFSSVFLFLMMIIVFLNAMARYISGFDAAWSYEIVTSSFVVVSMFSAANVFIEDGHIGFEYLVGFSKGTLRVVLDWIRNLCCLVFFIIMTYYGILMVLNKITMGVRSPVLLLPSWIVGCAVPISGVICIIRYFQHYFNKIKKSKGVLE